MTVSDDIESDIGEHGSARMGQDEILRTALARGMPYQAAADLAGVSRRTVARRMADPDFADEVAEMRGEYVSVVTGRLLEMAPTAIELLFELLHDENVDRRLVVKDILHLGRSYHEHSHLSTAVARLRAELDSREDRSADR